mmetsp:Transcript_7630/g.19242  ORF Transcript_7630/g.19242 Transcript_7630/m.19242 type:complete len:225 (+) Transcript_7630:340-1014(+)
MRQNALARLAHKMLGMPVLAPLVDDLVNNRAVALCALLSKQLAVVHLAVRLPAMLPELHIGEGLVAMRAHKMLGVVHAPHGCDAVAHDGLAARVAHVLDQLLVILPAVQLALELVAIPTHEVAPACLALVVLWVDALPLQEDVLVATIDWLFAAGADGGAGVYSLQPSLDALVAIDFIVRLLDVGLLAQVGAAAAAHKVLWVVVSPKRGHALANDDSFAVGTAR